MIAALGRNDYGADDYTFKSIELPGKEPAKPNRDLSLVGDSITIRSESERSNDRETATTTVRIYDIEILPVRINWFSTDVYSGYHGISGSSKWQIYCELT